MPRKFLGERISSNIDAIRPASMVLTDEMLQCIPKYNFTELDNCEQELVHSPYVGTRLSRKYGGTLYLKKRLQSVPALFMQEHRRLRLDRQGQSRVQPMPLEQHHGISNSTQREMDKNEPVMSQGAAAHKTWEGIHDSSNTFSLGDNLPVSTNYVSHPGPYLSLKNSITQTVVPLPMTSLKR